MSTPDSQAVNLHKRIAMGEKLDGTSLAPKAKSPAAKQPAPRRAPAPRSR